MDALIALSQRTLIAPLWEDDSDEFRTLKNSNGELALPLFTDESELEQAARQFGWNSSLSKEVGARAAFNHSISADIGFVVIDIMADHKLEIERPEVDALLAQARLSSPDPFAVVGKASSQILQAVESKSKPEAPSSGERAAEQQTDARNSDLATTVEIEDQAPSHTFLATDTARFVPLQSDPADELLSDLSDVLRGYPEIEWAAFGAVSEDERNALPTVGLRADPSYRDNVPDIVRKLREKGRTRGTALEVLLLDEPKLMRAARADAVVFFPWRRK